MLILAYWSPENGFWTQLTPDQYDAIRWGMMTTPDEWEACRLCRVTLP